MKKKLTISNLPKVGDGATISIGSDRYPATVVQVSTNGHKILLQEDDAIRLDNNGLSELQDYRYERNLNGSITMATLRKDGRYRVVGGTSPVSIGTRNKYYDPSF